VHLTGCARRTRWVAKLATLVGHSTGGRPAALTGHLVSPIVAIALCVKSRGLLIKNLAAKVDAFTSASADFAAMRALET
jgi:hypothetical protein